MTEAERWARDLAYNESEAFEKALKRTKEEKNMYIDGRWLTEPEIEAYIKRLRREIAELRDKHENECRQISEYDIENKALREHLRESQRLLKAAVFVNWKEKGEADKLYDEIAKLIGR